MKRWAIISIILICLVLVGSMACNPFGGNTKGVGQQLVKVERGNLAVTVSGSGTVEVSNERKLAFSSGGKIDKIYVDESDKVNKGDTLYGPRHTPR